MANQNFILASQTQSLIFNSVVESADTILGLSDRHAVSNRLGTECHWGIFTRSGVAEGRGV